MAVANLENTRIEKIKMDEKSEKDLKFGFRIMSNM